MSGKIRPENEVFMQCRGKSDPKMMPFCGEIRAETKGAVNWEL